MKKQVLYVMIGLVLLGLAVPAIAADETGAGGPVMRDVWKFIAAAFVLGIAAFAGAFGQARAVASACTSMGRNPGAAGPVRITMLLGVAFIESLVIYALVIAFMILGNTCTRSCGFCAVAQGAPRPLDPEEPLHVAEAVAAAVPDKIRSLVLIRGNFGVPSEDPSPRLRKWRNVADPVERAAVLRDQIRGLKNKNASV